MREREQFIPVDAQGLRAALLEKLEKDEATSLELQRIADLLRKFLHLEYLERLESLRELYLPVSPESQVKCKDDEALSHPDTSYKAIRTEIEYLLRKANFDEIDEDDLEFAMRESHVFDLPVEIDWESFDGEPLIYTRGRDHQIIEGRFVLRKLPGYLLRGAAGNMVIGVFLILLGLLASSIAAKRDGVSTVTLGAAIEEPNTLGPDSRTRLDIQPDPTEEGERIDWKVEILDSDGERFDLPDNSIEFGEVRADKESRTLAYYYTPKHISPEGFEVIVHARHLNDQGKELSQYSPRSFAVSPAYEAVEVRQPLEIASIVLLILGAGGVLIGAFNLIRKLTWDDERRRRYLLGEDETLREMTRKRNAALRIDRIRDLWRWESIPGDQFRQIVIAFKLKESPHFLIKLFKDVPLADLELIFPNTKPRMKLKDRLLMVASVVFAGVFVLVKLIALVATAVLTFGIGTILALLSAGGVAGRTWAKFRNLVSRYQTTLSESLYYRNLDNNFGVVHYLIDSVEEQEFKEAILAYSFLLAASSDHQDGLSEQALDSRIEAWLTERFGIDCDFECDDALEKLERWELVKVIDRNGSPLYQASSPASATSTLRNRWSHLIP